jgi:hypothetical protein
VVGAGTAGTAATAAAGFEAPEGAVSVEPAAGDGCAAALAVVAAVFLAVLAGGMAFAAASGVALVGPDDAAAGDAGVATCVAAEGDVAGGAGCVVAEAVGADSAGVAAGFATTAGVLAPEGAVGVALAVAAFTACWQADDSFARLPLRHCSAWEPPRGTLLQ